MNLREHGIPVLSAAKPFHHVLVTIELRLHGLKEKETCSPQTSALPCPFQYKQRERDLDFVLRYEETGFPLKMESQLAKKLLGPPYPLHLLALGHLQQLLGCDVFKEMVLVTPFPQTFLS